MNWVYSASGFVVGLIVGLTGVGGGSLMTPLLVLLLGVSPATAVGTDLLYASLTKAVGSCVHARRGSVDWRIVGLLALGSLPASLITVHFLHDYSLKGSALQSLVSTMLGVALLLTAAALLLREQLSRLAQRSALSGSAWRVHWIAPLTVLTGVVLGVLVTISSVGAGALGVVALLMLYPKLPAVRVVGTDIAHAVPLTLIAGLGHASLGTVDWHLLVGLLIGSIPGISIGSYLAARAPERMLRSLLATILIAVGGRLVI